MSISYQYTVTIVVSIYIDSIILVNNKKYLSKLQQVTELFLNWTWYYRLLRCMKIRLGTGDSARSQCELSRPLYFTETPKTRRLCARVWYYDNDHITFCSTKGKNIPSVNTANTGPPITPNTVNALWYTEPKYFAIYDSAMHTAPYASTIIFIAKTRCLSDGSLLISG